MVWHGSTGPRIVNFLREIFGPIVNHKTLLSHCQVGMYFDRVRLYLRQHQTIVHLCRQLGERSTLSFVTCSSPTSGNWTAQMIGLKNKLYGKKMTFLIRALPRLENFDSPG